MAAQELRQLGDVNRNPPRSSPVGNLAAPLRLANEKGPDTEADADADADAGAQLCHRNRAPREASGVMAR